MIRRLLAASLFFLAAGLPASDSVQRYLKLKDNSDLYVGEGQSELKDFSGDGLKALAAASERAQAALAASIRVRVTSETSEKMSSGKEGSSEEINSKSKSLADVILENIHSEEFPDVPDKGKVTVLAWVSKEDYRRQLAGKGVKVYLPEYGFRIGGGASGARGLSNSLDSGVVDMYAGEFDFVWRRLYLGYQLDTQPAANSDGALNVYASSIKIGYEWIPWAWRVQPYVPLQGEYSYWTMGLPYAQTADLSSGLGLRYWANDSVALQYLVQWHQDLWGGGVYQRGGDPLLANGSQLQVSLTGIEFSLGITWSGF